MVNPTYSHPPSTEPGPINDSRYKSIPIIEDADGTFHNISDAAPMPVALGGAQLDAFGRHRVSAPGNRLDAEFTYDLQPDLFDSFTTNGTITHNATARQAELSLSAAAAGNHATLSSHPVPYTPGCSQLSEKTGVLDLAGIGTGTVEFFLRSNVTGSVTEQTVAQADWDNFSTDRDWTDSHIFAIDFQSLKVGTIRGCMVSQGASTCVASIHNDNLRNSGYWQTPTLPVQYRIYIEDKGQGAGVQTFAEICYGNDLNAIGFRYVIDGANASATMAAICCTVKSEGGADLQDMPGFPRAISTRGGSRVSGGSTRAVTSSVMLPIMSIRSKAQFNSLPNLSLIIPDHYSIYASNDVELVIIVDGTLTGASWVDVNSTRSCAEYDISATVITGGVEVKIDPFSSAKGNNNSGQLDGLLGKALLWDRQDGVTGILTIAAIAYGATASCRVDLGWKEIR